MASLKRYKQASENTSRFQDLPPRFKRQKSLTSKQHTTMESSNQNAHPSHKNKKSPLNDNATFNGSTAPLHYKGLSAPREGRKIVKKLSTQKAQINAEKHLLKPQQPDPFILSPMENKLFSLMRNDDSENPGFSGSISQDCSSSAAEMLGFNTMTTHQQQLPLCNSHTIDINNHHNSGYSSPTSFYSFESDPITKKFTHQKQHTLPTNNMELKGSLNNDNNRNTNYSDPDIRTIEMLRELERVADQTDMGTDENCNDKNSLVSHHLRMLMCAVDRYTQGVDEGLGSDIESHEDEIFPQEQPRPFKISSPQMPEDKIPYIERQARKECSVFSEANSFESRMTNTPPMLHHNMLNTWNPWSTPSFNALDVYASQSNMPIVSHPYDPSMFFDHHNSFHARDACF